MSEAIISRRGYINDSNGGSGPNVPITPGYCSALVTVYDAKGSIVPFVTINCQDGGFWYNTHTNATGQALITCNSGKLNVIARNYSIQNKFVILDQAQATINNISAPINKAIYCNMRYTNDFKTKTYTASTNDVTNVSSLYNGNCSFRVAKHVNVSIGGGGGGGGTSHWRWSGSGGGGGGYSVYNGVTVSNSQYYKFYIGAGGSPAAAGGSTSAFGNSVTGGRGGTRSDYGASGGSGGTGMYSGGSGGKGSGYDTGYKEYFPPSAGSSSGNANWGGGGGGGASAYISGSTGGGSPYGGAGGSVTSIGRNGTNGGGGGGGGGTRQQDDTRNGGYGGNGMIQMTIYA